MGERKKQSLWSTDHGAWHQKKGNHSSIGRMTHDRAGVKLKRRGQTEGPEVGGGKEDGIPWAWSQLLWREKKRLEEDSFPGLGLGPGLRSGSMHHGGVGGSRGWCVEDERRLDPGKRPEETSEGQRGWEVKG